MENANTRNLRYYPPALVFAYFQIQLMTGAEEMNGYTCTQCSNASRHQFFARTAKRLLFARAAYVE